MNKSKPVVGWGSLKAMTSMKKTTVTIDKLVIGGDGLGRLDDGMVVMVNGVLPGERVVVLPKRKRSGYIEADLVSVLDASPIRVSPPCPHFGICGGCDLQHAEVSQQAEIKAAILRDHLLRGALFNQESLAAVWREPLAAPRMFNYRQRIRLQVDGDFLPEFGFHRHRSHQLEPVESCLLARNEINVVLAAVAGSQPMTQLLGQSGEFELLYSPADQDVILFLHFKRKPRPGDLKAAEAVVAELGVRALLFHVAGFGIFDPVGVDCRDEALLRFTLSGLGRSGEELGLTVEPGGFCQVNPEQNLNLIGQLLEWCQEKRIRRVLDCHCGMGNFSLPLAAIADEVVGCDMQGASIRSARRNAEANGIGNCRFEKMAAAQMVAELIESGETFDCILLDPPRMGCADIVPLLPRLNPERIIYISCDPATLHRDLAGLSDLGYRVRALRMVDMFPQTAHMESITLLEKI